MGEIGIKLADGSFYPIMDESAEGAKKLDVTTSRDNQPTVLIDLYRSQDGGMENAEYVDTLRIDNLKPHPNGEPSIKLSVSIDGDRKLRAEAVDSETGGRSETSVTLFSRTAEERLARNDDSSDVTVSQSEDDFSDLDSAYDIDITKPLDESAENADEINEGVSSESESATADETIAQTQDESAVESGSAEAQADDIAKDAQDSAIEDVENFPLPDFGDFTMEENNATEAKDDGGLDSLDFDLPDFDSAPQTDGAAVDTSLDDLFGERAGESSAGDSDASAQSSGSGLDFNGLYDKETAEGKSSTKYEKDDSAKKKTRAPVVICVVCAIICVIMTLLILFVIPSQYNLLSRLSPAPARPAPVEREILPPPVEEEPEIVHETVPIEESAAQDESDDSALAERVIVETVTVESPAKEDEIVVASDAEKILPEPPAPPERKEVLYKIKWGDTLWDISASYLKTPWKYKRIAKYNGIKNPDKIISGTTIKIPSE